MATEQVLFEFKGDTNQLIAELKKLGNGQIKSAGEKAGKDISDGINKGVNQNLTNTLGDTLKRVLGGLAGVISFGAIFAGAKEANQSFVEFDDNLASVRKSVGLSEVETKKFGNTLIDLSKDTRTSATDLAKIAAIGGQLGVGEKDIKSFTESINKLNVALGDEFLGGAGQIAKEVGTLVNIFQDLNKTDLSKALLNVGNAINSLGQTGIATGPVITDFATRIAGLAPALGAGNILGVSATLQELGVNADRGGSAVGRIVQKMASANEKEIPMFAKAMGITNQEFIDLVNNNPNEALILLSESLAGGQLKTTEFASALDKLGLEGVYISEVIQKLGANTNLLKERQALARQALEETSSILSEYDIKNNTALATQLKFNNQLEATKIKAGEAINIGLRPFYEAMRPILAGIEAFIVSNPEGFATILGGSAGIAILASLASFLGGPVTLAIAGIAGAGALIASKWKQIQPVVQPLIDQTMPSLQRIFKNIIAILKDLEPILKPVFDFLALALGVLLVGAVALLVGAVEVLSASVRLYFENIKGIITAFKTNSEDAFESVKMIFTGFIQLVSALIKGDFQTAINGALKILEGLKLGVDTTKNMIMDSLDNLATAIFNIFDLDYSTIGRDIVNGIIRGIKGGVSWAVDAMKSLANSMLDGFKKTFGIASPSKVMQSLADNVSSSFGGRIEANIPEIREAGSNLAGGFTSSVYKTTNNNTTNNNFGSFYEPLSLSFSL